ncbi:MAG: subfamily B ATP-binding cassette protein MsbA [Flavobacteriaceae bacterium]|jgi:subfamily B ATP-binding cassette protein MsbA|uniref:ABC transporter ATP-binding protein n=1 Tax=Candidatus Marifrigoribacter sp. Uisw_064 TaxID=3230970 RepID=UPI003ADF8AF3
MNYFKQIVRFAIPYKWYAILNIIANIFYALFSGLSFMVLMPLLKVLFDKDTEKMLVEPIYNGFTEAGTYFNDYLNYHISQLADNDASKALTFVIILILAVFFLKNIFNYLAMYFITFLRNGTLKDIRNELYDKTIELPLSYFSEKRKGDIMARLGTDVLEIQHSFLSVLELIFREPLTIIFTILFMLTISVKLTIFVFIFIPISGVIISLIGKSLKKKSDKVQKEQGYFLSLLEESLGGLKVIKGFNMEGIFSEKFQESTKRFFHYSNSLLNRTNLAKPTSEFLGIGVIGVLLWFGGRMVLVEGTLGGEQFLTFMGLAYNILTPAKAISKASYSLKKGNAAAERVLEILNTESPLKDRPNALSKNDFDSSLVLNNISFKYEDTLVLKSFTINIEKGKTVAFVGQSGSGKSTIANLVTRFYDVNEGQITIDGQDIRDLKKHSLRNLIGLVTQDSILFHDTIKNNILNGKPDASDEEVIEALKIANAWEFVKDLKGNIEFIIGDSGSKLSGGQKQRLSIARAVLKNPPIMILDEATSALDTESERIVQNALENMMKNRTSIVIAHRLSTIQNADNIVVLSKGEIVEQGKHHELLDLKGVYFNLVKMQSLD